MTKPLDILTEARLEDCLSCPAEKLEERVHKLMTMVKLNCDPNTERDSLWETYTRCCGVADPQLRQELLRLFLEGQKARYIGMNEIHRVVRTQFYPLLEDALGLPEGQLGGATGAPRDPGGHKTNRKAGRRARHLGDISQGAGKSLPHGEATKLDLIFQLWSEDSGIFLKKEDFVRLSAIHHALETARTWGEFERLCPEGEFASLSLWQESGGEYVYKVDGAFRFIQPEEPDPYLEDDGQDYIITPEHRFDSSRIPGVEDADYPPWLCSTADELLSEEFRDRFGEGVGSPGSGAWTEYPVSEMEEMMRWLDQEGFSVTAHLSYDWDGAD